MLINVCQNPDKHPNYVTYLHLFKVLANTVSKQKRTQHTNPSQLRTSLKHSQKESFSSSLMTGSLDQYINAFAIFLGASVIQIGWLNALPQLLGGVFQLISVWFGQWIHRHKLIVISASIQVTAIGCILLISTDLFKNISMLILLISLSVFHITANIIMPHWRAWMGQLVPDGMRGRFFGRRSRIAMLTSFSTFLLGGLVLTGTEHINATWLGFFTLFSIAFIGRSASVIFLAKMHDDHTLPTIVERSSLKKVIRHFYSLWADIDFRRFTIFMALIQCFVALSGPFFTVYMLRDLNFTYLEFTISTASSIIMQFIMLPFWGRICDKKGNRYVMAIGASIIPILPLLWLFSDAYLYIIFVQMLGGLAWSGFSLASANYLYDQKPRNIHFASYAALHASIGAFAVFIGAISGGYLIDYIPTHISMSGISIDITRPITVIFILSTLLRAMAVFWYIPKAPELRIKERGRVRDLILRVARFTPTTGIKFDVINRRRRNTD